MQKLNDIQIWVSNLDERRYAIFVGMLIGMVAGGVALLSVVAGPVLTIGGVAGLLIGLYLLTSLNATLYTLVILMFMLPSGTLPFQIGFTPTLMDVVIGILLLVYLVQWMTRQRQNVQLTGVHLLILIYMMWLIFSFALGLRHSSITLTALRQFVGTLLSISLTFILVDMLRESQQLRRLVLVIMLAVTLQAILAVGLYVLPDNVANTLLNALGRIGYPQGNVIRYIEQNPQLPERAIGTWIDPNSLGGIVAIAAVLIAPQVFAKHPVLKYRWLSFLALALVSVALILTFSRASVLAFVAGLAVIGFARYRRYLPILVILFAVALLLPQTQDYLYRFVEAFTAQDLSTQMRIGEWTDSLRLISRYPVFGVGFTGTPEIDIYTDVANMYLMMANQIGLVGLMLFLLTMIAVFAYGAVAWGRAKHDAHLDSIHLGYHAALVTGLINAIADLYFFRLEYQGSITWFWIVVALCIASSRLVIAHNPRLQRG
ncbi:MAG: hypothetical protein CUN52_07505 [Phototrophicales bacterium]|nr:MAG: hypothetical protein CUN52_07505 [Phototrophicales bacterium]